MLTLSRLLRLLRLDREEGQVLPMFAIVIFALFAMTGVVIDGGNLFQNRQSLQNAADASAIGAALYVADNSQTCATNATDPVGSCAGQYASLNGANGTTGNSLTPQCTTNLPNACALPPCNTTTPGNALYVTDTQAPSQAPGCYVYPYGPQGLEVEVWLTRKTSNFFGGILGIGVSTESARAVASLASGGTPPPYSFVTLQSDGENHTLLVSNVSQLNVDNSLYDDACSQNQVGCQYVQGSAHDAFDINEGGGSGGALLDKKNEFVVGGWEGGNNGSVGANGGVCTTVINATPPNSGAAVETGGTSCPWVGEPYLADPFALLPQPTPGQTQASGAGTVTFPVTQEAASRGVATLTANNNLSAGAVVQVSGVDDSHFPAGSNATFNGFFTVKSATATTISYTDSSLPPTTTISATSVSMMNGVAKVTDTNDTVSNLLANGDSVNNVQTGNVNYDGAGPFTVSGVNANSFQYTPAISVPVVSGSIATQGPNGVATLTTSGPAGIPSGGGNSVTVTTGDKAYDATNVMVTSTGTGATTFTYSVPQLTNVSFTVNSATSATLTLATGTIDTNITSIKVMGTGPAMLDGTYTGANLTATPTGFTIKGTNFATGHNNTNAMVTILAAGTTTFNLSFPTAVESAVTLANANISGGTVGVPYFLAATNSTGSVTTSVPSPTAGNPFPVVKSSGTLTPGTYFGGICLGSSNGTDCVGTHCAASGTASSTSTVTMQAGTYIMAGGGFQVCGNVTLSAPNVMIYSTNDASAPAATYGTVGQVEFNTNGSVTLGPQTAAQSSFYAGFTIWEDRNQVVDPPSSFTATNYGAKYQLTSGITAAQRTFDITATASPSCSTTNNPLQAPACLVAGNLIEIDNERMMVTLVVADGTNEKITVTRAFYQTSAAIHAAGTAVQSVAQGTSMASPICDGKAMAATMTGTPSEFDVVFLHAGTAPGQSGPFNTISGTVYAAGPRADVENNLLGVANLAVLSSCIFIDSGAVPSGSPTSEFDFQSTPSNPLGSISAALSG